MKTKIFLLLIAAALARALVMSWEPDPSVEANFFLKRFRSTLHRSALLTDGVEECDPQEAQAPLEILWHPRRWYPHTSETDVVGYHDGVEHFVVKDRASASVDCFIRYLDGRASFVVIRAKPGAAPLANTLRSALAGEFPGLPIELQSGGAN
jgi:hypothetical protein